MNNRCICFLFLLCIPYDFALKSKRQITSDNGLHQLLADINKNNAFKAKSIFKQFLVDAGKKMKGTEKTDTKSNFLKTISKNNAIHVPVKSKKVLLHIAKKTKISKNNVLHPVANVPPSRSDLLETISKNNAKHPPVKDREIFMQHLLENAAKNKAKMQNVAKIPSVPAGSNLVQNVDKKPSGSNLVQNVAKKSSSVTTTTRKSWFDRMKDALGGVLVGIVIYILAFPMVTIGEGSFVHRRKVLKLVKANIESDKDNEKIDTDIEANKPIIEQKEKMIWYETGNVETKQTLVDNAFKVSQEEKLYLHRKVEMYQYYETSTSRTEKDTIGGGETTQTTYHLKEGWFETRKANPEHHQDRRNPQFPTVPEEKQLSSKYFFPDDLAIKEFKVSESQRNKLKNLASTTSISVEDLNIPASLAGYKLGNGYIVGSVVGDVEPDINNPKVGTIRISWIAGELGQYTLICGKNGDTWAPYTCDDLPNYTVPYLCCGCCPCFGIIISCFNSLLESQNDIDWLEPGTMSVDDMFEIARKSNVLKRILFRLLGFFMFWLGAYLILRPIAVFVSVIGFLGSIVSFGIGLATLVIGLVSYLLTLAFTWLYYRPLAAGVVVVSAALIVVLVQTLTVK